MGSMRNRIGESVSTYIGHTMKLNLTQAVSRAFTSGPNKPIHLILDFRDEAEKPIRDIIKSDLESKCDRPSYVIRDGHYMLGE